MQEERGLNRAPTPPPGRTQCSLPPASEHMFPTATVDGELSPDSRKLRVELGSQAPDSLLSGILYGAGLPGRRKPLWPSPRRCLRPHPNTGHEMWGSYFGKSLHWGFGPGGGARIPVNCPFFLRALQAQLLPA